MLSLKLTKLKVENFRNLESDIISFGPKINCIFGENGNGKTNILEAIFVLINRKSFRKKASFPQYLGIDGEKPEILFSSVFTDNENNNSSYSAKISPEYSEYFLNNKIQKRKLSIGTVFINPFDSYGFHNKASDRRLWFDGHIGLLDPSYKTALNKYTTALRFRNNLLSKKPQDYRGQINAIDREIAKYSVELTAKRKNFIEQIKEFFPETFRNIFSEEHDLDIVLDTKVNNLNENQVLEMLQSRLSKDEMIGHTSYGIHKDDYTLLFDGMNSYDYCSLGQQKMSYLSLLFAYISLFRYKFTSFPIVLLDDVSGELDGLRWKRLIDYLEQSEFQVFITTANERFKHELEKIQGANKLLVTTGKVETIL